VALPGLSGEDTSLLYLQAVGGRGGRRLRQGRIFLRLLFIICIFVCLVSVLVLFSIHLLNIRRETVVVLFYIFFFLFALVRVGAPYDYFLDPESILPIL